MKHLISSIVIIMASAVGASAFERPPKDINSNLNYDVVEEIQKINVLSIDWNKLDMIVSEDENMTSSNKISFKMTQDFQDPIERDKAMKKAPYYDYLRSILYPKAVVKE